MYNYSGRSSSSNSDQPPPRLWPGFHESTYVFPVIYPRENPKWLSAMSTYTSLSSESSPYLFGRTIRLHPKYTSRDETLKTTPRSEPDDHRLSSIHRFIVIRNEPPTILTSSWVHHRDRIVVVYRAEHGSDRSPHFANARRSQRNNRSFPTSSSPIDIPPTGCSRQYHPILSRRAYRPSPHRVTQFGPVAILSGAPI